MTVKFVIQCAGTKNPAAGSFKTSDGRTVKFVASPELAPLGNKYFYTHPESIAENGKSWRENLIDYNANGTNPFGLKRAFQLYSRNEYRALVSKFGASNIFILSAGWGLVGAEFLLPDYNITFSNAANVPKSAKRKKRDKYLDFQQLIADKDDEIVFIGGKDYQDLFVKLTDDNSAKKTIIYNSSSPPKYKNVKTAKYETNMRTNWHYELANSIIDGSFSW